MRYLSEEPTASDLYAFLSSVTRHLSASLDLHSTLETVSRLSLPYLNSWCIVDFAEESGNARRIAIIHPDTHRQELARRLTGTHPPGVSDLFDALASSAMPVLGVPPIVTDACLAAIATSPEDLEDLRALCIGTLIRVPLVARSKVVGAITFLSSDEGHQYGASDMAMAADLAARCAMALDNARLYTSAEDARSVAAQMNERLVIATLRQEDLTEEARAANLAKSQFLAMMSHELRTPLNAIVGYADLIDLGIAGTVTTEQRRYISKVHSSAYHLVGIIDDILDLAKIQAGHLQVDQERESAASVINEALTLVEPQASKAGLRMRSEANCGEELTYYGDAKRVRQILANLLSNAVKFTGPGGHVSISCESVAAGQGSPAAAVQTVIRVTDTGMGISEADLGAIFEPFVQLGGGKTRTKGGTGLGLTISRELAQQMGGDLTVSSTAGVGSCFSLWLPAAPPASVSAGGRGSAEQRHLDRRMTV